MGLFDKATQKTGAALFKLFGVYAWKAAGGVDTTLRAARDHFQRDEAGFVDKTVSQFSWHMWNDFFNGMDDAIRSAWRKSIAIHLPISSWGFLPVVESYMSDDCKLPALVVLLHGRPGVGKSYLAQYLSAKFRWNIMREDLSINEDKDKKTEARELYVRDNKIGQDKEISLIDEVDRFVDDIDWQTRLQNFIDDAQNGFNKRVIILTTNHYDKIKHLPLCREGRIDIIAEVGLCSSKDVEAIAEFYGVTVAELGEKVGDNLTIANIQQQAKLLAMAKLIQGSKN
jgi:hypothetical protein